MTETLQPLPGVAELEVDFDNRLAHVKTEPGSFDVENAISMLADKGYPKSHVVESTN